MRFVFISLQLNIGHPWGLGPQHIVFGQKPLNATTGFISISHIGSLGHSLACAFLSFDGRLQRRPHRYERHHAFRRHLFACRIVRGLDRYRRQIAERCGHALH